MTTTWTDTTVEDVKFTWPILMGPTSQQDITEVFQSQKEKYIPIHLFHLHMLTKLPAARALWPAYVQC